VSEVEEQWTIGEIENEPGAAGDEGHPYDSHSNIATCSKPAFHPRAESNSATDCKAGGKGRSQAGSKDSVEADPGAAGAVQAL